MPTAAVRKRLTPSTRSKSRSPVRAIKILPDMPPPVEGLLDKLRDLWAKIAKNPDLEHVYIAELEGALARIEHPSPTAKAAAKAAAKAHEPAARVTTIGGRRLPGQTMTQVAATTCSQAHGLRAALGLRTDPEQDQALATRMTRSRAEGAGQGHAGRQIDPLPAGATPQAVHNPAPVTTEFSPTGERLPQRNQAQIDMALVFEQIVTLYVARDRQPITLDARELARLVGISAGRAEAAMRALEARGSISRQSGRVGTTQFWSPSVV